MNTKRVQEIIPPEPHSTGADFHNAWNYMPCWLQIIVVLAFIVAGILVVIFSKRQSTVSNFSDLPTTREFVVTVI
jgi:L-asparagine transporter-like permease